MKSKQSLKSSAKRALSLCALLCLVAGCSYSSKPSYRKEIIASSIQTICKEEYQINVKAVLVGSTLWVYVPVEDMFIKNTKQEKYTEKFIIQYNQAAFQEGLLKLEYLIKAVPEKEKPQEYKYNKKVLEKVRNVLKVIQRVIFSMERHSQGNPQFFCLVVADIKNAFETKELFYEPDLKKATYNFISWSEYQHRATQEALVSGAILGDKEGAHVEYKDITFREFITRQIDHRIRLKFQKPEVDTNVDIDKEITKIVASTINAYGFKDFSVAELNNLLTNNKTALPRAELLENTLKQNP
jgi:hypothetical protein